MEHWKKLIWDQSLGYTEQIAEGNTPARNSFCRRIKSEAKAKSAISLPPPADTGIQHLIQMLLAKREWDRKQADCGLFFFLLRNLLPVAKLNRCTGLFFDMAPPQVLVLLQSVLELYWSTNDLERRTFIILFEKKKKRWLGSFLFFSIILKLSG